MGNRGASMVPTRTPKPQSHAPQLRILLADDHAVFRQSVRLILERTGFHVIAEAADGSEAVRLVGRFNPDVAILDFSMPGLNGIDAAREIHNISPATRTILLTMHEGRQYINAALRAGMLGVVLKSRTAADLVRVIHEVAHGALHISPDFSSSVMDAFDKQEDTTAPKTLTMRERQILQMIADGKTNREMAHELDLSPKTIDSHRSKIMQKLNIHRTAELILYSIRHHLIEL
jgi:two-component system, NarL family, response regulator NreC